MSATARALRILFLLSILASLVAAGAAPVAATHPGSNGTLASPGHIGLYLGHGLVVHAPRTGDVVKVTALDEFIRGGVSGLRHVG